jgi:hypothetical protein
VLIAGKAIGMIQVVAAFLVVEKLGVLMWVDFGVVEFAAFLIAWMRVVFERGCFSSLGDR